MYYNNNTMVLNKRGGNKSKKQKSSDSKTSGRTLRTKDSSPDSCELYGKVTKRCGGNPPIIEVISDTGIQFRCVVRGKMRNRVWMNPNDFVLFTYNPDSTTKQNAGEIVYKYEPQEVTKLEKINELSLDKFRTEGDIANQDDGFVFAEEDTNDNPTDYYSTMNTGNQKVNIADLDGSEDDGEINFDDI